ncbi:cyclic nucleotide-binding-like protein, partial [Powellomyces hirtus]
MYFVVRGVAEVFSEDDGTSFAEFHPGAFFGEVGIFFHVKRTASVRCTSSQVAVFKLDKEDLDDLLKQYPEVRTTIQNEAKTRFQYNKEREKSKVGKQQQEETEIEVIRERMKAVPLFKDADIGLRHQLALMLTLRVYPPGASIVQKDEVGNSMYFVLDGIAEVVSEDGLTIYAELNPNSFFGEVALLFEVNRTATVRSRTQTTMFELSKDALTTVLEQNSSGKGGESEFVINMKARAKANFELFQERQKKVEEISTGAPVEEFGLEATANRLKQVSIFQNCDDGFLRQVALGTSVRQDQQNTIIVKKG